MGNRDFENDNKLNKSFAEYLNRIINDPEKKTVTPLHDLDFTIGQVHEIEDVNLEQP